MENNSPSHQNQDSLRESYAPQEFDIP